MKIIIPLIIAIIAFAGWIFPVPTNPLGGTTADFWDAASYKVGGTEIITSGRAASFTTGSFSSTLGVTGLLTSSGGLLVDRIRYGGGVKNLTATNTSITMTASDICDYSIITRTALVAISTTTFPTATSVIADCLTTPGDSKVILFKNGGSSASTTFFVAGSGMTFLYATSTGSTTLGGGEYSVMTLYASSTTAIDVMKIDYKQ